MSAHVGAPLLVTNYLVTNYGVNYLLGSQNPRRNDPAGRPYQYNNDIAVQN